MGINKNKDFMTEGKLSRLVSSVVRDVLNEDAAGGRTGIIDSHNNGEVQRYELMIPASEQKATDKFLQKCKANIPGMDYVWSQPRDQVFKHPVIGNDGVHARAHMGFMKQSHTICDLVLEYPVNIGGWELLSVIEQGVEMPVDMTQPLKYSNPEHGKGYGKCDACGRPTEKLFYVLRNKETGEEMQVGGSCVKKYGLGLLNSLYKLQAWLTQVYDFGGWGEEDDEPMWPAKYKDMTGKQVVEVALAVTAAKKLYDGGEKYVKGETARKIFEMCADGEVQADNSYFEKVKAWFADKQNGLYANSIKTLEELEGLSNQYNMLALDCRRGFNMQLANRCYVEAAKIDRACSNAEFNIKLYDFIVRNHYIQVNDLWAAWFAVEKYEKNLERAADDKKPLAVGTQVEIHGEVVKVTYEVGMYGESEVVTIKTDNGYTLRRKGKVPYNPDTKRVDGVYAVINYYHEPSGIYFLDRVTKAPKKGIETMVMKESVDFASVCKKTLVEYKLSGMISSMVRDILSEGVGSKNNLGYSHFAVWKPTGKIVNGWDYSEYDNDELRRFKRDYFIVDLKDYCIDPKRCKIVTDKSLRRMGIDPDDDSNWGEPDEYVSFD